MVNPLLGERDRVRANVFSNWIVQAQERGAKLRKRLAQF
jgi:hypothetical protein